MEERFLVLSTPRSGTHILSSYISSHKKIFWSYGEPLELDYFLPYLEKKYNGTITTLTEEEKLKLLQIFFKSFSLYPVEYKRFLIDKDKRFERVGFSSHIRHFLQAANCGLDMLKFLNSNYKHKIILLKRKNLLRQLLSFKIAVLTDKWSSVKSDKKITLCPKEFEQFVYDTFKKYDDMESLIKDNNISYKQIFYEDFIDDKDKMLKDILLFLNLENQQLFNINEHLIKQETRPIKEILLNYNEFVSDLNDNLKKFLD